MRVRVYRVNTNCEVSSEALEWLQIWVSEILECIQICGSETLVRSWVKPLSDYKLSEENTCEVFTWLQIWVTFFENSLLRMFILTFGGWKLFSVFFGHCRFQNAGWLLKSDSLTEDSGFWWGCDLLEWIQIVWVKHLWVKLLSEFEWVKHLWGFCVSFWVCESQNLLLGSVSVFMGLIFFWRLRSIQVLLLCLGGFGSLI